MSDADKALAEVRGWLCDNLGSSNAGKVCGMLSVVSRRISELEAENAKLRQLLTDYYNAPCMICNPWAEEHRCKHDEGGNCLLATMAVELGIREDA